MRKLVFFLIFVSVIGLSCEDLLEVPDISNETVRILAPSDSTNVASNAITFSWEGVAEADAYLLQIAQPNFEQANQIVLDTVIALDSTFTGTKLKTNLPNEIYQWRIKALNQGFETKYTLGNFTVNAGN